MLHNIDLNEIKNFTGSPDKLFEMLSDKNATKYSKFSDDIWVFDTKPNLKRINFENYYAKTNNNKTLILFWKLFIYIVVTLKDKKNKGKAVFASNSVALLHYLNSIGFPENIIFTSKHAEEFINILHQKKQNKGYKTNQLSVLKDLIKYNQYLPLCFRLPDDPLKNIQTDGIFSENNNYKLRAKYKDENWSPLTIPQAMYLTRESIKWVEDYADDILEIYAIWKDYAGKYPKYKEFTVFGKPRVDRGGFGQVKNLKLAEITWETLKTPTKDHPFYPIWHLTYQYKEGIISQTTLMQSIKQRDVSDIVRSLYGACIVLILMSTGMRKSELYSLQRGCIDTKTNPELPLITSDVLKTNTGITKLPISHIGAQAIRTLEKLAKILTGLDNGPLLVPVEKQTKDSDPNKLANYDSHLFNILKKYCTVLNYGEPPNSHAFRHTLAACVWERTDQAPVLLQILYNHSSLSMTLHYLRNNPLIKQAQHELFTKKYLPLVREVIHSEKANELSGHASQRVHSLVNFVQQDLSFKGKTEEELETAIEELFMTLIEQDQLRLFLTPFCICMRPNTSSSKSPCMHVEDHGDSIYATLPRTDRCVGASCHDSLFVAYHQKNIEKSVEFYNHPLENIPDDLKSNIFLSKIIENESKKYKKIDKQLYKTRTRNA